MSLIEPLPQSSDPELAEMVEHYQSASGYVPNSLFAMQRRPDILKALQNLHSAAMTPRSRVTAELKVLLAHVVSAVAGCRYCQAHTALGAHKSGASDEKIAQIWEFRTSPLFSDAERAALELAAAAGVTPNAVTCEMRSTARDYWSDDELVEIVAIISVMGFMNRWHETVGTQLEDKPKAFAEEHIKAHGWEWVR